MAPASDMPAAEVEIDAGLVRRLLAAQFPDLAGEPVEPLAFGWDNAVYRLGPHHVVRLPRRAAGAELVEREQRWLPDLSTRLPLPIPAPVGCGVPGEGYPWRWSVCPWLPGDIAARSAPADDLATGEVLGRFVRALHQPAPPEAPENPLRGVPLSARDGMTRTWVERLGPMIDGATVLARWAEALAVPRWPGPARWLHGDLHPANLLVADGRLSAVIDFGDLTAGDPATDLAVAWMLFDAGTGRSAFRIASGYGGDDDTWARARGWALGLSIAYLANSADHAVIAALGRRTLAAVLADAQGSASASDDQEV